MYASATTAVDRFGYLLPNLSKEETSSRTASAANESLRAKSWTPWRASNANFIGDKRLKQLIRDGVPQHLRPTVWLQLSGGSQLRHNHSQGHFQSLNMQNLPKTFFLDVESAILRHMPGHSFLSQPHGLQSIVRIVQAYHQHTKTNLQLNTSCIAAFLVSVLGLGREEDCFWIMLGMQKNGLLISSTTNAKASWKVSVEQLILEEMLKKRCPKLLSAFANLDMSLHQLTANWFTHLFCGILPAETTVRVWDCLLHEGQKVYFRVGLALLKREEAVVLSSPQRTRNLLWRVSRTYNADSLLKLAFKGIGSLSMSQVTAIRKSIEASLLENKSNQTKRLEALLCPPRLSPQPSTSSATSDLSTIAEVPDMADTQRVYGT